MDLAVVRLGKVSLLCAFFAVTSWAQTTNQAVVPAGSVWAYLNQEQPPTAAWKEINFHQSGWPTGFAQLGYGDGDEQTITRTTPPPHPLTAYFRHSFLAPTNLPVIKIRLLRDDGAVVYINGQEVLRDNMPDGEIIHTTAAASTTSPDSENSYLEYSIVPVALLQTTNVVAVEVHQANAASSDLGFDLELIAGVPEPPATPVVTIQAIFDRTSEPLPTALVTPGRFEIARWERDLTAPLRVDLAYEGTASAADYEPLPTSVVIPAGGTSVTFDVLPRSDDLFEEAETVIAQVVQHSSLDPDPANRPYTTDPSRSRAKVLIADEDTGALPTVMIQSSFSAHEPRPNENPAAPGFFRIVREGDSRNELSIFLRYEGTATPGVDYDELPQTVTFPPNQEFVEVFVHARGDGILEDPETVVAHLISPPIGGGTAGYVPSGSPGMLQIIDNGLSTPPSLRITEPRNGEFIPLGQPITITVVATDPKGYISRVEFFANDQHIGRSEIVFVVPPAPGTPITHSIIWSNAPAGEHLLDALARDADNAMVASPEVRIVVAREQPPVLVSIRTIDGVATEPSPNSNFADEAMFEITRTTGIQDELRVLFSTHGTATEGSDYAELTDSIVIPAGQVSATIKIAALPDALTVIEPAESVGIRLQPAPNMSPVPPYEIASGNREAGAVILDHPGQSPALVYIFPEQNEQFELNERTTLLVAAYHRTNSVLRAEFLLDDAIIGVSEIPPTDAWNGVFFHRLPWVASPAGQHRLTARITPPFSNPLTSEPIDIVVGPGTNAPPLPVVSLETIRSETVEMRPNYEAIPGQFRLRRTGNLERELSVLLRYEGTATSEIDYARLPDTVTFKAGEATTNLYVGALEDDLIEETETVIAQLVYPPDAALLPGYIIDPNGDSGTVRIVDTTPGPVATLRITEPQSGAIIRPGEPIEITAVAIDRQGYIPRVEFFANGTSIGVSEIAFLVPPNPGTPITHTITWNNASAGEHVIIARASDSRGNAVASPEVRISVGPDDPRVFVSVTATDPFARELPILLSSIDPAIFEITRTGGTNNELVVFFSLHGTAQEGVDYVALEKRVVIPAGRRSTTVMITPLPDPLTVVERMETVGIRLEPSPDLRPVPLYEVASDRGEAAAVIFEREPDPNVANIAFAFPNKYERLDLNETTTLLVAVYHATQDATHVDFFLDGEKIGSSDAIVPPDEPGGLVFHRLVWQAAPAGQHQLKAVAVFPNGLHMETSPLPVIIGSDPQTPLVSVRLLPPSTEPFPDADHALGSFEFARTGSTNESLAIYFQIRGTATEGVDYVSLSNRVIIPAGRLTQELQVQAIDDRAIEGEESVALNIILPPPGASPYIVALQNDRALVPIVDNDSSLAQIVITRPASGQLFPLGIPIDIEATATDPNGYIPRVEFFADNRLIGVSEIVFVRAPDPGTPIHHSLVWSNAPAGEHILTVRSVDSAGQEISSNPVRITVRFAPDTTLLALEVIDAEASEPTGNNATDPAIFRVRRVSGPTNEPVSFLISLAGTAANGVDYENVHYSQHLLPGQRAVDIVVTPIYDALGEGEETVALTLVPRCNVPPAPQGRSLLPFAPLLSTYCVVGSETAQAVIRDGSQNTNPPPRVTITSPRDGAVFEPGRPIFVSATANRNVAQFNLYSEDQLLWRTNGTALAFMWSNAPAGQHTLRAVAIDAQGATGSASIRILVRESNPSFVERDLPDSYLPGAPLTVHLLANPPSGTRAWAVEDQPPRGWVVSHISHRGVFDAVTGKVKFGHFTEILNAQTLTYVVTPPAIASGEYEFTGNGSADGASFAITGDRILRGTVPEHHPADTNREKRIVLAELTAYAAAWKSGTSSNSIPVSYVTRAAMIWRNGETYHFVPNTAAPECWVPDSQILRPLAATTGSGAVRSCAAEVAPNAPFEVTITVQPPGGTSAFAIEEHVPPGWTPTAISNEGTFDTAANIIRWGVFMDTDARTLRYTLTPPAGVTSSGRLHGVVSFDGSQERTTGSERVLAADASVAFGLTQCERRADGTIQLQLAGASGQLCVLEFSTDLQVWTAVSEVFLPGGELTFVDDSAAGGPRRFYRLRVR